MNTFKQEMELLFKESGSLEKFTPILLDVLNTVKLITEVRKLAHPEQDMLLGLLSNLKDSVGMMPIFRRKYKILYDVMHQSIRAKYHVPNGYEFTYLSMEAEKTIKLIYKEL